MNTAKNDMQTVFVPDLIVSGGQTGCDYGTLLGAKAIGIPTGGIAPKGWRTEHGPKPEMRTFGLVESESEDYNVRTKQNVLLSDAIILVARNFESAGSRLTKRLAIDHGKPHFEVPFPPLPSLESPFLIDDIRAWLVWHRPGVLMFAGNRESVAVGIEKWTQRLVCRIFV